MLAQRGMYPLNRGEDGAAWRRSR